MASKDRQFTISIDINAPADRVYEVMSEVDRWPEWTPSVTSIKRLDTGPFVVGSRAVIRQPKFPPALWTVTAIDGKRGFTWTNRAPGITVTAHHSITGYGNAATATLSLRYEGLLGGLLARVTRGITNRYLAMEARGLKARSENPFFLVSP
jgi:uncharacterized protein YndB with AHSA1/START domain